MMKHNQSPVDVKSTSKQKLMLSWLVGLDAQQVVSVSSFENFYSSSSSNKVWVASLQLIQFDSLEKFHPTFTFKCATLFEGESLVNTRYSFSTQIPLDNNQHLLSQKDSTIFIIMSIPSNAWFDTFRDRGPVLYDDINRTPAIEDVRNVLIYITFLTIFIAFLIIFPGIRKEVSHDHHFTWNLSPILISLLVCILYA